jgi:hypothetical protein
MFWNSRRVLIGTVLVAGAAAALCVARSARRRRHSESLLDDTLRDSFPASDPPATQDFGIPANRR